MTGCTTWSSRRSGTARQGRNPASADGAGRIPPEDVGMAGGFMGFLEVVFGEWRMEDFGVYITLQAGCVAPVAEQC